MNRVSCSFRQIFDGITKDPCPADLDRPEDEQVWKLRPIVQNPFTKSKSHTSSWVHMFYDLAWATSFSSLAQNVDQSNHPWDTLSFIGFFTLLWWLWAAQAMYTIHFYTDDWFHLITNVVQMLSFCAVAASMRGYDLSNYIVHSPGTPGELEPRPRQMSDITDPMIYSAEVSATKSFTVIAATLVIHRATLILQYTRTMCLAYAMPRSDSGNRGIPIPAIAWELFSLLCSLTPSMIIWTISAIISQYTAGRTIHGARTKLALWGVALVLELCSHIIMAKRDWYSPPAGGNSTQNNPDNAGSNGDCSPTKATKAPENSEAESPAPVPSGAAKQILSIPNSGVTLPERAEVVTVIVLGEGLNGIAGAFYNIASSPQGTPIAAQFVLAAMTVCMIGYFYFENPSSRQDMKGLRQLIWLFLHLPFLLGATLLLLGVKDQLLLANFLSKASTSFEFVSLIEREGINLMNPSSGDNPVLKDYFIKRGITWSTAWGNLSNIIGPIEGGNLNDSQVLDYTAWQWRLRLRLSVNDFQTLIGDTRRIPDRIQSVIDVYYANRALPVSDDQASNSHHSVDTIQYYQILAGLLDSEVQGARYIMVLAGIVLVILSLLSFTRSKPRDRFQWGIVLSRFAMGWSLAFLLLLNLGRYQTLWVYPEQKKHQAGAFQWLTAYWVLPTIAIAYVSEVIIELVITWLAKLTATYLKGVRGATQGGEGDPGDVRPRLYQLAWASYAGRKLKSRDGP